MGAKDLSIELRQEVPTDYRETEELVREAFWNYHAPGCVEHYLLNIVRDDTDFVPELDYIAVHKGTIVGSIVYLKGHIDGDDGKSHEVLTLGPIAVLPDYQNKGVGGRLIEHTRSIAQDLGYRAILLCGDPAYYVRYGFVAAEDWGIRTADNHYAAALQVSPLYEAALEGLSGQYYEAPVYEFDEALAAEFDKGFPPKERIKGLKSQKRFNGLVVMRREAETPYRASF